MLLLIDFFQLYIVKAYNKDRENWELIQVAVVAAWAAECGETYS